MRPSDAPTVVAVAVAREPHWPVLAVDLNWRGLWDSPSSVVAREVARLESRLHNPAVTDHIELIEIKSRLAAYVWLRETVDEQAKRAHDREVAAVAAATEGATAASTSRRSFWRRGGESVLPPVLG